MDFLQKSIPVEGEDHPLVFPALALPSSDQNQTVRSLETEGSRDHLKTKEGRPRCRRSPLKRRGVSGLAVKCSPQSLSLEIRGSRGGVCAKIERCQALLEAASPRSGRLGAGTTLMYV